MQKNNHHLDFYAKSVVPLAGANDKSEKMKEKVKKYDLKGLRRELKMSQEDAALAYGISTRSWQRLESGGVSLVEYVKFVEGVGGKFVFPDNPFGIFEREGKLYSLTEFEV